MATGATPLGYLGPEHTQALELCRAPVSVAEIAAHLKLPAAVTKVLLSDLVDCGALTTKPPEFHHNPTEPVSSGGSARWTTTTALIPSPPR